MEGVDPESLFEDVKEEQNRRTQNATEVIEWFLQEENIGEMYPRSSIVDEISDELSLPATEVNVALSDVVGDIVDPLQQILREGERYVGIIEYREYPSEGAYGYIDFDDKYGERKRVVCARCVETEEFDDNISHATEGEGSVPDSASWNQLLNTVTSHYTKSHTEAPTNIEVGASLLSGTTIAGNESWHAGNDGSGSGLDADNIRGTDASTFASNAAPVQSVNSNTGDVVVQTGAQVQDGEPTNPQKGDLWVDTSALLPITKWYSGTTWNNVESFDSIVETESDLPSSAIEGTSIFISNQQRYVKGYQIVDTNNTFTYNDQGFSQVIGIRVNPSGSKLYVASDPFNNVYQFNLSNNYDISTASLDTSVNGTGYACGGIVFTNSGGNMWVGCRRGDSLEPNYVPELAKYDLSTNYDLNSATQTDRIQLPDGSTNQNGIGPQLEINNLEDKLYVSYDGGNTKEYELSTPGDLASFGSATSSQSFNRGISWINNGSEFLARSGDTISIYTAAEAYALDSLHLNRTITISTSGRVLSSLEPTNGKIVYGEKSIGSPNFDRDEIRQYNYDVWK